MRREHVFWDVDALMKTDFIDRVVKNTNAKQEQVLKSMSIEREIFKEARKQSEILEEIETDHITKLAVIDKLTADIFQSFYSLNVLHNPDKELTPIVRKINQHIVDEMMKTTEYSALKSISEGKQYPAIEATEQFMEHIASNLEELMDVANGKDNLLDALQNQEKKRDELAQKCFNEITQSEPSKKILRDANRFNSLGKQIKALDRMVRDNLMKSKSVTRMIARAVESAKEKAEELQSVLKSWGNNQSEMKGSELDKELVEKVRNNSKLLDISRYLGRFREILQQKRLNGYAFGRGEKYSIELGNKLSRLLSSEYMLLATNETIPLFLRKYQQKTLKQYARRERICKGQGDIIICLDESGSTIGENATWGKAVAFAMLELARLHNRNMALIHFSDSASIQTDLFLGTSYTQEDVMQSASLFLDGGTDFETPMIEAVRLMETDDFANPDILFITDGICEMSESFKQQLKEKQLEHGFTITGILLDQDDFDMTFSLESFCTEIFKISEIGGDGIVEALFESRAV